MRHLPMRRGCAVAALAGIGCLAFAEPPASFALIDGQRVPVPEIRMGDAAAVRAILDEGSANSRVLEHLYHLSGVIGPRLTGSTRQQLAAEWARDRFASWGLEAELWEWGTIAVRFDRVSSVARLYLDGGDEPARVLDHAPLAWTRGTDGPARGPAVPMPRTPEEYESNRGRYAGAWVVIAPEEAGRRGVRSTSFLMRERLDLFDRIRAGGDEGPEPAPEGFERWTGTLTFNGRPMDVRLDLPAPDAPPPDADGQPAPGTMKLGDFAEGAISDLERTPADARVSFTWTTDRGVSDVTLTLDGGSASGEVFSRNFEEAFPITLARLDPEAPREPSLWKLVLEENPLGFVSSSQEDRVRTTSRAGWRERPVEEYGRDVEVNLAGPDHDFLLARMLAGQAVELEFDLRHELTPGPIPVHNVVAEIRGSTHPEEVVILSAHLDSWDVPGSQGTVDNGTGSAVTMEAARILAAVGARPERTIRFILWTGEEQGLLGSRAYVDSLSEEEKARISVVFVDDGGTNFQGGLAALPTQVPLLAAASAPVNARFRSEVDRLDALIDDDPANDEDAGWMNVNIRTLDAETLPRGGGSDHAAFNEAGIPGFFWDEIGRGNYWRGWHTQFDRLDLAIPEYLVQSAVNSAVVAYNLANAPTLLPRTSPKPPEGDASPEAAEETTDDRVGE